MTYAVESKMAVMFEQQQPFNGVQFTRLCSVTVGYKVAVSRFFFLFVLEVLHLCCIITGRAPEFHCACAALRYMSNSLKERCESIDK